MGCDHEYWGDRQSNPTADPNPRLQLLIDAARRGAHRQSQEKTSDWQRAEP